jgi:signal transduction histidine kinase
MSAEVLSRFREPFFTTKDNVGTGLGMWVVQELLAKRGASMAIRTSTHSSRHGTVFNLFFPCQIEESSLMSKAAVESLVMKFT